MGKIFVLKYFHGLGATTKIYYHENLYTLHNYVEKMEDYKRDKHERLLLLVLRMKVSPLGPVNHPCATGITVESFWPRSAVLRLHIRRLYNMLLFVVKNISCDKFS